ncbi:MAG: YebC/PmpR family DNA-binding transcriptional regulator [Synergistaceae bacterium]|nr:YebC/PmpR family DNA-binding transcriptional regulator [Synergistaceae bacterium]MBR0095357.1 YebC/PmpR family DNA-binding transcriptional regulator [Synergistaceae bacterium]
MSGHSKWANIKHRKAAQDAKRGNLFQKLVRAIIIAAKDGGGDPAMNMRLKTAIERAKAVSVPNDNITRAIKRGTGELGDISYDELTYEAYGPSGIAVLVNVMTDNRNRTTPEIRALLSRNGGQMGESGSVAWMFDRKGVIEVKGEGLDEDELMTLGLDSGMSDMEASDGGFTLYCEPGDLDTLQKALEDNKYVVDNAEVSMVAKTPVEISDPEAARKVLKLIDALEEHDDVQNVYSNFEIPDEVAAQIEDE